MRLRGGFVSYTSRVQARKKEETKVETNGTTSQVLDVRSKRFYRQLEAILEVVQAGSGDGNWIRRVHTGILGAFGDLLHLRGGTVLVDHGGFFLEDTDDTVPVSVSTSDAAVALVVDHGVCLFRTSIGDCVRLGRSGIAAVLIQSEPRRILTFELGEQSTGEEVEFALRTLRSALDHRLQTDRMHSHLEQAFEIQRSLLPSKVPVLPGFEFAAFSSPAERVGGDFYDFLIGDEVSLTWVVGDASGHGLGAALLARDVVTGLRMGVERELKLAVLVERLGRVIARGFLSTRFTSLFLAEVEREGNVFYVNAGHPSPWVLKASGDAVRLDVGGAVLGPMEPGRYRRGHVFLEPGDLLFAPTDGLLERTDRTGEMFGEARVTRILCDTIGQSVSAISRRIETEVSSHGPIGDDTTWILLRRLPVG
ncbi:MAG: SpoIIE family protein phosphatase [Candidatus Eisenbacteria bacterium]|nr:SpoIIE family protein phosphatase [Candidatus Eisenbacteria bacterium]